MECGYNSEWSGNWLCQACVCFMKDNVTRHCWCARPPGSLPLTCKSLPLAGQGGGSPPQLALCCKVLAQEEKASSAVLSAIVRISLAALWPHLHKLFRVSHTYQININNCKTIRKKVCTKMHLHSIWLHTSERSRVKWQRHLMTKAGHVWHFPRLPLCIQSLRPQI